MQNPENSILYAYFQSLPDPRMVGKISHKLIDIVMIAISAVLSGAESWTEIELFGQIKREWLSTFPELPNGIPSHDTFREVFRRLDPVEDVGSGCNGADQRAYRHRRKATSSFS